jgi:hypothetical protein
MEPVGAATFHAGSVTEEDLNLILKELVRTGLATPQRA